MPQTGTVFAAIEVAFIVMLEEPSRLPIVLPVMFPMFAGPSKEADPLCIPIKGFAPEFTLERDVVCVIPEIIFP